MVKVIKQLKLVEHRSHFLNLAVPSYTTVEPGEVQYEKLLDDLKVSIWDRWELKDFKEGTLK